MSLPEDFHQQGEYIEDAPPERSAKTIWSLRALGLVMAGIVYILLGGSEGLTPDARFVAAIGTLMAIWWITEAIPLSATSLLPIVLIPAFTETTVKEATAPYASDVVFLFLGGFLIAIAMEKWNLHRRVALLTLRQVGVKPRQIVLGMMLSTGFLSMWVSNTATTLMMLPIGMSVLALVINSNAKKGDETGADALRGGGRITDMVRDKNVSAFGVCLILSVAWAASIGGLGTLLGSPPNAIVAGYASENLGRNIGFVEWMMIGLPLALIFILVAWFLMTRLLYRFDLPEIPGGKEMIDGEIAKLGSMSQGEKMVLTIFLSAAFLWVVPGLLTTGFPAIETAMPWIGQFNDSAIAVAAGLAMFIVPGEGRDKMLLNWKDAEEGLPWGVLLLFGGGLSFAAAVGASDLDAWFGMQVEGLGALPSVLLVAAVVTLILFLTEVTSNTATAATFIPILGGVALGIGADAMSLLIPAALAATCAFMLPVGTPPNAIVFGTGAVTIAQMARGGFVLNIVGIVLITGVCYLIGGYAMGLEF